MLVQHQIIGGAAAVVLAADALHGTGQAGTLAVHVAHHGAAARTQCLFIAQACLVDGITHAHGLIVLHRYISVFLDQTFVVLQGHEVGGPAVQIDNQREGRLVAVLLHLALSRLLSRRLGGAADAVQMRLLGDHVHHYKTDGALVAAHTGQAGEQIAAAVVVNQGFAGAGTVLVLITEVQVAMHVLALVVQLGYNEILRLNAIYPVGKLVNAVTLAFAGGAVEYHRAGGLRQREAPQILIGSDDPVGLAGIVQLKAVIGQAGEGCGREAGIEHQVLPQIGARLVFDGVAVHILHVLRIDGGYHHITGSAFQIGKPFEYTGMVGGYRPDQLSVHLLQGGLAQHHLAAQAGTLAQFFVRQLLGHGLIHNGQLAGIGGVEVLGEVHLNQLRHLIPESIHLKQNAGSGPYNKVRAPEHCHQNQRPAAAVLEAFKAHTTRHSLYRPRLCHHPANAVQSKDGHQHRDQHTIHKCRFRIKRIQVGVLKHHIQGEYQQRGQHCLQFPMFHGFGSFLSCAAACRCLLVFYH